MTPKDFLKKELNLGDKVVFVSRNYRMSADLKEGTITRFTPQKAEVASRKLVFFHDIVKI